MEVAVVVAIVKKKKKRTLVIFSWAMIRPGWLGFEGESTQQRVSSSMILKEG